MDESEHSGIDLFVLSNAGGSYNRIVGALERWHRDAGADDPQLMAMLEARVLVLLVIDHLSQEDVARSVGESPRAVARYVADLRAVFPDFADWQRPPKSGSVPQLESHRSSRRWEKAPADGAWREPATGSGDAA